MPILHHLAPEKPRSILTASASLLAAGALVRFLSRQAVTFQFWLNHFGRKTLYMTGQLVSVGGGEELQTRSDLVVTYLVTLELDPNMTSPSHFLVYWGGSALTFYHWLLCILRLMV